MKAEKERIQDVIVVRLQYESLTGHEAPEVKTGLLGLLTEEADRFVLNLKAVRSMDSTGLGAFLFGIRQAEAFNKELVFCELSEKSKFLLKIAHLDDVLDIYESEAEALEALTSDGQ